jgi:hypothetical protein
MKQQWVVLCYVFTSSRREREETGTGSNTVTISISDLTDVQLGFDGDIPEKRESAGGPSRAIEYNSGWDGKAEKGRTFTSLDSRWGDESPHQKNGPV